MTAATPFLSPSPLRPDALQMSRTCVVRLIDRRTGALHRVNGTPLTVYTRNPRAAVAEMMLGRDPAIWEARIDLIDPVGARA